jgi:hypothetical protein
MPLPKPHDGEKEEDFIERCMSDEVMEDEYPDEEQRLAICSDLWDDGKAIAVLDIERKAVTLKLDEEKEGSFVAKIATLNVIDMDGDVTLAGAFPEKKVLISTFGHTSWMGGADGLPPGEAHIKEEGGEAIGRGLFNLKSDNGRNHYESIKFSPDLYEWSYGFKALVVGSEKELEDWAKAHDGARPQRILKKVKPFEISPVLLGAGIDTATLAIKSQATYADQAEAALAAVTELVSRTKSLADLRRKEGRVLSSKNRERISKLLASLSAVASDLKELLEATEPDDTEKLAQAVMIFTKIKRELAEVS